MRKAANSELFASLQFASDVNLRGWIDTDKNYRKAGGTFSRGEALDVRPQFLANLFTNPASVQNEGAHKTSILNRLKMPLGLCCLRSSE